MNMHNFNNLFLSQFIFSSYVSFNQSGIQLDRKGEFNQNGSYIIANNFHILNAIPTDSVAWSQCITEEPTLLLLSMTFRIGTASSRPKDG